VGVSGFAKVFGRASTGTWAAPGRVNLIGEHTDYNDGFVLPFALPQTTAVEASSRPDRRWQVWSAARDEQIEFDADDLEPGAVTGWAAYAAGVVWALQSAGYDVAGADLAIESTVPVGAGLSSSAALECSLLFALDELNDLGIEPMERARIAQRAENDYVGMPCGLLDQAAATLCRAGHALFLDCRSGDVEHVPLDPAASGVALLLIDPHAPHRLVDGEYAARRSGCESAARHLGLRALRDAVEADLDRLPDDERRLARHVVSENDRVLATAARLRSGKPATIGPLLVASHASMRDDFRITVPEVDLAVDAAIGGGALGARMTGGGFGGTVIALVPNGQVPAVELAVDAAFSALNLPTPTVERTEPSRGAQRVA